MLLRFNDFLNKNPNYTIDMFKKVSNEILKNIEYMKLMNNKNSKNTKKMLNKKAIHTKFIKYLNPNINTLPRVKEALSKYEFPRKNVNYKVQETEPVITEPVITEPIITEPVITEPVITEPVQDYSYKFNKKTLINNNNVNNIINKKIQNKTIANNISIIDTEINKFNLILKSSENRYKITKFISNKSNIDQIPIITTYLKKHIQNINAARGNFINKTTKKSFLNRFKKNTLDQTITKQSYYRLLLENNFICRILTKITNNDIKIDTLLSFIKFLNEAKNNYTIEQFNNKIKIIGRSAIDRLKRINSKYITNVM